MGPSRECSEWTSRIEPSAAEGSIFAAHWVYNIVVSTVGDTVDDMFSNVKHTARDPRKWHEAIQFMFPLMKASSHQQVSQSRWHSHPSWWQPALFRSSIRAWQSTFGWPRYLWMKRRPPAFLSIVDCVYGRVQQILSCRLLVVSFDFWDSNE